jgi:hypothetical protein
MSVPTYHPPDPGIHLPIIPIEIVAQLSFDEILRDDGFGMRFEHVVGWGWVTVED